MENPSTLVIRIPRRFGALEARALRSELNIHFVNDETSLVFDLSQVRQIDVAGADALLQCVERVIQQDGSVQLSKASPEAATLLELLGMDKLFEKPATFSEDSIPVTSENEVRVNLGSLEDEYESASMLPVANGQIVAA
jgi:anti-anti-sigma factor